ncbi:MAG: type II toxin-antitoxin system RelE/ParE family toxin [Flavobacteriales bacterium]|nr:type II toxin-antitoxin system RelE/ParE family toxin [Flavobacteriales bacterium]
MTNYRIHVSNEAFLDLAQAFDWYEEQRSGLGSELELCVDARIHAIARNPFHYQERYKQVHIAFVDRFPYGIHYLIEDNDIRIIGIFHMSRNPENWNEA